MEKEKKSLKLIHIIFIGCIIMISFAFGVIYSTMINNEDSESKNKETENFAANSIKEVNKDYFSKEIEVPKDVKIIKNEGCKNDLKINNAKIDNEKLILKLELDTKNDPIKNIDNISIINEAKIEKGNDKYVLNETYYNVFKIIELRENLYEIYSVYDVEGLDFDKNIKFTANIAIDEFETFFVDVGDEPVSKGSWNIEFAINEEMKTNFDEKYKFENLIIYSDEDTRYGEENWEILQASILEENIILNGILQEYTTEPGILYTVEIFDEKDNSLMIDGKEFLIGGVRQDILLKKFNLDSEIKIKFEVSVYGENRILGKGEKKLKIADYQKKTLEPEKIMENAYNSDLEFSYDSNKWEIQVNNAFDVIELDNLNYPINIDYKGNYDYSDTIIINKYENIFNESLEEVIENRKKLLELGIAEPRKETYTIAVDFGSYDEWGNSLDRRFYDFTDEEVNDIYNGKTVLKEDVEFNKVNFKKYAEETYVYPTKYTDFGYVYFDEKESITFVEEKGKIRRNYILIVGDYIYEIKVPFDLKLEDEYYEIVDTINFK